MLVNIHAPGSQRKSSRSLRGLLFSLSAGQGLEHKDIVIVADRIGQLITIGDAHVVDVDHYVAAEPVLVIQHVGA